MRWKLKVMGGGGWREEPGRGGERPSQHASLSTRRPAETRGCQCDGHGRATRYSTVLWVCDDAAVYRCGGEGPSGMARDQGEAVCDAVCGWERQRRRTKVRDKHPEGPVRSKTDTWEEPAESREDKYWRSRACLR